MKMKNMLALLIVALMAFSVPVFATEVSLTDDQIDYLNKVGCPSAISDAYCTELGTVLNGVVYGQYTGDVKFKSYLYSNGRYGENTSIIYESSSTPVSAYQIAYSVIQKRVGGAGGVDGAGLGTRLPNGISGQVLTLQMIYREGSGTWVITPITKSGFTTITMDAVGEFATLIYMGDTLGWCLQGTNATIA